MTVYASVGIKQIQAYLARSRRLWGRRGASDMLSYLTDARKEVDEIQDRTFMAAGKVLASFPGVRFDRDAVDVDAVLNICGDDHDEVARAAEALALNIKRHLPAAHVHTTVREADGPIALLRAADEDGPVETRQYPPVMIEFPLAHHCDECSSGMATVECRIGEDSVRLCADCVARRPLRGRQQTLTPERMRQGPQQGFMVEQQMLQQLKLKRVPEFKDLAAMGDLGPSGGRTSTGNHLATIFADGNGFGGLFHSLRRGVHDEAGIESLQQTSKSVKDATGEALAAAILEIQQKDRDEGRMPAIPHILGGDDILVSVPATRAWRFLLTFLKQLDADIRDGRFGELSQEVSFSAGMVICHYAYPIGDQVDLAARTLRIAKERVRGKESSISWLDVTNEGPTPLPDRFLTLGDWPRMQHLVELAGALGNDAKGGNTARDTVRRLLRVDVEARGRELAHLAERLPGSRGLFDDAFGTGWEEQEEALDTSQLDAALSVARWYR